MQSLIKIQTSLLIRLSDMFIVAGLFIVLSGNQAYFHFGVLLALFGAGVIAFQYWLESEGKASGHKYMDALIELPFLMAVIWLLQRM